MTQQHPITPPPELVQQWREQAPRCRDSGIAREDWLITRAAQWGADQELETCCEWLDREGWSGESRQLRAARRPKPPSLKEEALKALDHILNNSSTDLGGNTIRRALEQLPDSE
jgi:hypothetical protein